MVCIAPPPPQVAAVVQVGPKPDYPMTFQAADPASANYLKDSAGDWDFSCFKQSIKVVLTITTTGIVFYTGNGMDSVSYAETPGASKQSPPAHQFPVGIKHVTAQSIWFKYHNDSNCGVNGGPDKCMTGAYGLIFGDTAGNFLHADDPIIQNGGND